MQNQETTLSDANELKLQAASWLFSFTESVAAGMFC